GRTDDRRGHRQLPPRSAAGGHTRTGRPGQALGPPGAHRRVLRHRAPRLRREQLRGHDQRRRVLRQAHRPRHRDAGRSDARPGALRLRAATRGPGPARHATRALRRSRRRMTTRRRTALPRYESDEDTARPRFPFVPGNQVIHPEKVPEARCPHLEEVTSVEELLPYFEAVAKRPYSPGLWPAWGLQEGERVL